MDAIRQNGRPHETTVARCFQMIHDLQAMLLGSIVAFYWARVIKLVLKVRRQTGKAGNFLPPEPLGRLLRIIWYPTVVAWIVIPFVVALKQKRPPGLEPLYHQPVLSWFMVGVALMALAATMVCWRQMGSAWRMGIDPNEKTRLIVTGPFKHVRHPIYALSSVLMLACVVAVPAPLMIAVGVIHVLFLQWEALREERYLLGVHGDVYRKYLARTGRFLPRLVRSER